MLWALFAVLAALAVGSGFALWRRSRPSPPRASQAPPVTPSRPPPAPPTKLPPARIVLATDGVPVVELVRLPAAAAGPPGSDLDAPALRRRFEPVAREAAGLMPLPGSRLVRVLVRTEIARAIKAGILPLLVQRQPVAMPTGEGIEILPADPAGLADLGVVAWQTAGGAAVRRFMASLEGRIAALDGPALPGTSIRDTVAALRARRGDLDALAGAILAGAPSGEDRLAAQARLQEVEVSSAARTDALLRELGSGAPVEDPLVALRRSGGSLLVTVALRAAAVEVRALLDENPDLALTKIVELQALVTRATGVVGAGRAGGRGGADAVVAEQLALAKEIETALRAARERLFGREVTIVFEPSPDRPDEVARLWLA